MRELEKMAISASNVPRLFAGWRPLKAETTPTTRFHDFASWSNFNLKDQDHALNVQQYEFGRVDAPDR